MNEKREALQAREYEEPSIVLSPLNKIDVIRTSSPEAPKEDNPYMGEWDTEI
jgi:hypothetical protein